jgi:3-oxoacyl-(acyl-carrier-protein) synthase
MVENNEEMLTPTSFIQSTHNTVGAQIALSIKCHRYNNTFVHRGFSFESALLDAIMLLKDNEAGNVLAGSVDEITDYSHAILSRMGIYRNGDVSNLDLYNDNAKGTIAGEGAAFFLLTMEASGHDHAKLDGLHTFYKPAGIKEIKEQILSFLLAQSLNAEDIDLFITGINGDSNGDSVYKELNETLFAKTQSIGYKHLCGEYPTSSSFALWLATNIVKEKKLPAMLHARQKTGTIKSILIYNHYKNIHHSLLLVSAC